MLELLTSIRGLGETFARIHYSLVFYLTIILTFLFTINIYIQKVINIDLGPCLKFYV